MLRNNSQIFPGRGFRRGVRQSPNVSGARHRVPVRIRTPIDWTASHSAVLPILFSDDRLGRSFPSRANGIRRVIEIVFCQILYDDGEVMFETNPHPFLSDIS
jgi:hypothetical protein